MINYTTKIIDQKNKENYDRNHQFEQITMTAITKNK